VTPLYVKKNQINCLILKVKIATISILFQTTDILSITKLWQFHRYANISQHFQGPQSADLLEVSLLLDKYFKPQYLGVSKNKRGAE
jgi:hypothetical protein